MGHLCKCQEIFIMKIVVSFNFTKYIFTHTTGGSIQHQFKYSFLQVRNVKKSNLLEISLECYTTFIGFVNMLKSNASHVFFVNVFKRRIIIATKETVMHDFREIERIFFKLCFVFGCIFY